MMAGMGMRRAFAVLLAAVLLLGTVGVVPASAAASTYTASIEAPQYLLNDHTPIGVRWKADAATELAPNTVYYVKVRFTVGTSPNSATNRGFTWNPTSSSWVQEREDWVNFPTVTTDASGKITADQWTFVKFGDESVSGDYYVMVSLSTGVSGTTFNPAAMPVVHVVSAKTAGMWVHNGNALAGGTANKRAEITAADTTATIYSLRKSEKDLVDNDGDGTVDNEGNAADIRMGVSTAVGSFDVWTNRTVSVANDVAVTGANADQDIALGASDMVAPGAPTALAASTPMSGKVTLGWTAATDNTAVTGYRIYRWATIVGATPPYTPVPVCIGTVSGATTTFSDTTVAPGVQYAYEVRAVDAATNVSARSNTTTVTTGTPAPVYRFYNVRTGTHFYTDSADEKAAVIAKWPTIFNYEGVAYYTNPAANAKRLYRFYNMQTQTHFYTASDEEKAAVIAKYWMIFTYEGETYAVSTAPGEGRVPVYRFYNVKSGAHFYTASEDEKAAVIANWPTIFTYEGTAFWIAQ